MSSHIGPDSLRIPGSEPVIEIEGVSVRYRVPHEDSRKLQVYAIRRLQRRTLTYREFSPLHDIDLVVHRGESLGVVGHNGAGKSTLLKLILAVLRPGTGRVRVRGRVAPLFELGTGFDLELSGRENIFLGGMMLGFTRKDIARRFDRIVEFAGVGEFIDAPLRTYSLGMMARLGFSVATDVAPDILLIDEILEAGDLEFQEKSSARIDSFLRNGGTSVIASHSVAALRRFCRRVVWIDHGAIKMIGPAEEVLARYEQ